MKSWKNFFLYAASGALLVSVPWPVSSQDILSVNARVGIGIPVNSVAPNKQAVQLAPVVELIGVGMDVQLNEFLILSPFFDISLSEVLYSNQSGLVHPRSFVNIADSNYTTLLVFYIGIPLIVYIPLGEFFRLGAGVSPTMAFRIPLNGKDQAVVGDYYIRNGRFFIPEIIVNFGYEFQDVELLLSARVLLPISNLWDGDGSPFANDLNFSVLAQLRFILFESPKAE